MIMNRSPYWVVEQREIQRDLLDLLPEMGKYFIIIPAKSKIDYNSPPCTWNNGFHM